MNVAGKIIEYSKMLRKSTDERDQYASNIVYDIGYMLLCAETEEMSKKLLEAYPVSEAMHILGEEL